MAISWCGRGKDSGILCGRAMGTGSLWLLSFICLVNGMEIIRKRILIGGFPMYNKLILLLSILFFSSCEGGDLRKHLHERIYTGNDITASVYMVSEITTMHEFVDIKRWGHTRNILEANPGDIFE